MNLRQLVEHLYWDGMTAGEILSRVQRQFPERHVELATIQEMLEYIDQKQSDYETWN